MVNVGKYTSPMDPMGKAKLVFLTTPCLELEQIQELRWLSYPKWEDEMYPIHEWYIYLHLS